MLKMKGSFVLQAAFCACYIFGHGWKVMTARSQEQGFAAMFVIFQ
jgi:hypothetical protein